MCNEHHGKHNVFSISPHSSHIFGQSMFAIVSAIQKIKFGFWHKPSHTILRYSKYSFIIVMNLWRRPIALAFSVLIKMGIKREGAYKEVRQS